MNTTQTATAPLLGYQDDTVAITPDLPVVRVANLGRIADGQFWTDRLNELLADNGSLPVAVLDRYRNDWRTVIIVDNDSPLLEDHTEVYATRPTTVKVETNTATIIDTPGLIRELLDSLLDRLDDMSGILAEAEWERQCGLSNEFVFDWPEAILWAAENVSYDVEFTAPELEAALTDKLESVKGSKLRWRGTGQATINAVTRLARKAIDTL